jgi:hypothetical protein
MSQVASQTWALSRDANKSSGTCSVCLATRQLHMKDGTVHRHGARNKPCKGSNKPPLDGSSTPATAQPVDPNNDSSTVPNLLTSNDSEQAVWSPVNQGLIKFIPKSARATCAMHLAELLYKVADQPETVSNWLAVFNWPQAILEVPRRGGKRQNLTTILKKRISAFPSTIIEGNDQMARSAQRIKSDSNQETLVKAVTSKLEAGNSKAAIRLLMSDDSFASPSAENVSRLKSKHPPASLNLASVPKPDLAGHLSVEETGVRSAVMSFPAGTAGGPDGLRPQHLKDMISCKEGGPKLLSALTAFTNVTLAGRCPAELLPIFFGGKLIALNKKSNDVRPIVIGFTLRRLVAKCANSFGIARLERYFSPRQLGVGASGGCEAAIHASRRFLQFMQNEHVMVKLDFTNAFNSLHRQDMLLAAQDRIPELYAFIFSAYSQPSNLYFGVHTLQSNEGPQQGDPIGPLLFSNTIHPLLLSLESDLTVGYLDDVTLAGPESQVAEDVKRVQEEGKLMGLCLNVSKCELIAKSETVVNDSILLSFHRLLPEEATLLGAPLLQGPALDDCWMDCCNDLARASERLQLIGSHYALMLLRASFGAPRVMHLLRTAPSAHHLVLVMFGINQREAL